MLFMSNLIKKNMNMNLDLFIRFIKVNKLQKSEMYQHTSVTLKRIPLFMCESLSCKCFQPVGCGLEYGPSPAACAAADEPGPVFGPADPGPAGRSPSVSLGTTGHPGHASATQGRG